MAAVTLVWFMVHTANPPGAVLVWQVSQALPLVTGICDAGLDTTPVYWPLWQVPQTEAEVTPAWFIVQVAKPPGVVVLVWQVSHAALVGIWAAGLLITPAYWPLWQLAQLFVMPVWLMFQVANPPGVTVLVWQVSQVSAAGGEGMWAAGLVTTPAYWPPWQLAQLERMPVWLIVAPRKLVVLKWQVSQAAAVGMWVAGLAAPLGVPLWQLPLEQVCAPTVIPV